MALEWATMIPLAPDRPAGRRADPYRMDSDPSPSDSTAAIPLLEIADLQDQLMMAANDLDRLQRLLDDTSDALLGHFYGATGELKRVLHTEGETPAELKRVHRAMEYLAGAITGLQFQDMSSQLLNHTTARLRNCADRLAAAAMGDDEEGAAVVSAPPSKPNPVTQDEMDAGSIELF
jgi:hypothetical protein